MEPFASEEDVERSLSQLLQREGTAVRRLEHKKEEIREVRDEIAALKQQIGQQMDRKNQVQRRIQEYEQLIPTLETSLLTEKRMQSGLIENLAKVRDEVNQQEADLKELCAMLSEVRSSLGAEFAKRRSELNDSIRCHPEAAKDKWSGLVTIGSEVTTQAMEQRIAEADQELLMQEMEKRLGMEYEVHTVLSIASDDLPSSPTL